MKENKWIKLPDYVSGMVNQELLLQNEYLAAENRILRAHLPARLRLADPEITWPESASGSVAKPWPAWPSRTPIWLGIRRLIAQKFDGFKQRRYPGRP